MNPDCRSKGKKQEVEARNLCASCYKMMSRLVATGKMSIADFESQGFRTRGRILGESRFPGVVNAQIVTPKMRQVRGAQLK
jgi:hypothetical protein